MELPKISKTQQYRKVMKPMLERKRRARINKCLDQLKDLIIECMKEDDEHILKLEKADILEHTVEYLRKIKLNEKNFKNSTTANENTDDVKENFRNGYIYAANEVSKILATTRNVKTAFGIQLMSHLGYTLNDLTTIPITIAAINNKNENQQQQPSRTLTEIQKLHFNQQRSFSPLSIQISALSPVSSGYHSNLSSPVSSEDSLSSSSSSSITTEFNLYQRHINKNIFNKTSYNNNNSNKENVWRPW